MRHILGVASTPTQVTMSSTPLLGKDGAVREYIMVEDSPERAPSAFVYVPSAQPKRRLVLQLDHAKIACNAAHYQDRHIRSDLEEKARLLCNESALLRMRTVKYEQEKKMMLKSWEQRHDQHLKQVRVMNNECNQTCH
jgi:hypothetical protein